MGHEFQSPLRRWDVVAGLCQSIDARTYVEVGCREGRTTAFVLQQCPELKAIAIDPWREQAPTSDASRETYSDWDFTKIQAQFWENLGESKPRCVHMRSTGTEAAEDWDFKSTQLPDVVFIDALHDYESVREDIANWWPMVAPGGYLAGHDFNHKWPGVERAIAEHFNLMDVGLAPDSVWFVRKEAA